MSDALKSLRSEIDRIDEAIVNLLNKRARLAQQIGEVKKANRTPLYSPERERSVLDRLRDLNSGPMSNQSLDKIYREIMSSALALEDAASYLAIGLSEITAKSLAVYLSGNSASYKRLNSLAELSASKDLSGNIIILLPTPVMKDWQTGFSVSHPDLQWAGCVMTHHDSDAGLVHIFRRTQDAAGHHRPAKALMIPTAGSTMHAESGWLSRLPIEYADRQASGAILLQFKVPVQELHQNHGQVLSSCPSTFQWIY